MKLFELRACWEEVYDCPEEGEVKICDTYESIAFAVDDDTKLKVIAEELTAGFEGDYWSEERAARLRQLYPHYDMHRETKYTVVDVTDLIMPAQQTEEDLND
jgi:hypothetical protein